MKKVLLVVGLIAVVALATALLSNNEFTIELSEQQIQEKLATKLPLSKRYLLIFHVTLDQPRVELIEGSELIHAGLDVTVDIRVKSKEKSFAGTVDAVSALRYVASEGAFYLSEPEVTQLNVQGIPDKHSDRVAKTLSKAITRFYATRPVYKLKDSDAKQSIAKMVLKSVDVKNEKLIATLGL